MVDEERRVFRSELCPQCVLYSKPILSSLEDGALWKPGRRKYLEWIRVLSWREDLLFRRKLHNNLLHRDDLFDLSVCRALPASLDRAIQWDGQHGHHEWLPLDADRQEWTLPGYLCTSNTKYGKLPAKQPEVTPWETLCMDLIGPYKIQSKEDKGKEDGK